MESFVGVNVKRLNKDAMKLRRGSSQAAGADVAYCGDGNIVVHPGSVVKLPTGWSFEVPDGIAMMALPRSGIALKRNLRPANTPGLIDPDYRGELFIALENFGNEAQVVEPGEYIAQIMFVPFYKPLFRITEELTPTERDDAGFGSTETQVRG